MSDLDQIKAGLRPRMLELCERFLPAGKQVRQEWLVGSFANEPGDSLRVVLTGPKAGCGSDFATGVGFSNPLEFLKLCINGTFPDAIREAEKILGLEPGAPPPRKRKTRQQREEEAEQRRKASRTRRLQQTARRLLPEILTTHRSRDWRADLWHASPLILDGDPQDDWRHLLGLYPAEGIVWIGSPFDSGETKGHGHFRAAADWLREPVLPGPRIAASTFTPGSISRGKEHVQTPLFHVIEADELIGWKPRNAAEAEENKTLSYALAHWLIQKLDLSLVAAIDTGGKSVHYWMEVIEPDVLAELRDLALPLRLDGQSLASPINPFRLPGAIHESTQRPAQLLFLNPQPNFS